jgi:hypothetical protein
MDCEGEVSTNVVQRSVERPQPEGVVVSLYAHRLWRSANHPICGDDAINDDDLVLDDEDVPAPVQPAQIKDPGFWLPALIALMSCGSIIGIYWGLLVMIRAVIRFPL